MVTLGDHALRYLGHGLEAGLLHGLEQARVLLGILAAARLDRRHNLLVDLPGVTHNVSIFLARHVP